MIINYKWILGLIVSIISIFSCSTEQELFVEYSNAQIEYSGRIDSSQVNGAELYWSGSSVKINFEGSSLSALMEDENGDNYYNVILDNDNLPTDF